MVHVLQPQLEQRGDGDPIPHRYPDDSLCLYFPKHSEWTPGMAIADSVVPWASLWLYYYELWHSTGEWLGGGAQHRRRKVA